MANWQEAPANARRGAIERAKPVAFRAPVDAVISFDNKTPLPDLTLRDLSRMQAWDAAFAANIGMNAHPGTTRDKASPKTYEQLAALADEALALRDLRFPPGD